MGLGLLKPTEMDGDIIIYSKWCVQCMMPDDLLAVNMYALHKDLIVQVIRTAYRPADHKKATELWSCRKGAVEGENSEDYKTFVVYNGKIQEFKEFLKMIIRAENKMVKEAKTKDGVQKVPKAKRSNRKSSVASAKAQDGEAETNDQEN